MPRAVSSGARTSSSGRPRCLPRGPRAAASATASPSPGSPSLALLELELAREDLPQPVHALVPELLRGLRQLVALLGVARVVVGDGEVGGDDGIVLVQRVA